MNSLTIACQFAAHSLAKVAIEATGATAANVNLYVQEATGAHPSALVYFIEIERTGDTLELACADTSLEVLMEKLAECVDYSLMG